jgi:DNA-directed RNA polymerase specialized sigma subunit
MTERLTDAEKKVVEDNIRLGFYFAQKFRPPFGMDKEDWEAECLMQLARSVKYFHPKKGTLVAILKKFILNHRRKINSKFMALKSGNNVGQVSIDEEVGFGVNLGQMIGLKSKYSWAQIEAAQLFNEIKPVCSKLELKVLRLFSEGQSHKKIGAKLKFSRQKVTGIVAEAREKIFAAFPELASECVKLKQAAGA